MTAIQLQQQVPRCYMTVCHMLHGLPFAIIPSDALSDSQTPPQADLVLGLASSAVGS